MSFTSDPFIVGSRSRTDASAVPETTTAPTARPPLDILTYYYGSRMVYVSPGEDYDVRSESFPLSAPFAAVADRLVHPASHRHRRGVFPEAQRRRAPSDLSGGTCHAQPPEDSRDWPYGVALPRPHALALRSCGDTRLPPFYVGVGVLEFGHRANALRLGDWLVRVL